MIDLSNRQSIQNLFDSFNSVQVTDLFAMGNVRADSDHNLETTVVQDFGDYIEVYDSGDDYGNFIDRYCVVGREIVKITSYTDSGDTIKLYVDRAQYGTLDSTTTSNLFITSDDLSFYTSQNEQFSVVSDVIGEGILPDFSFRSVDIFENTLSWKADNQNVDTLSNLFGMKLESYSVKIKHPISDWNVNNSDRTYKFRKETSVGYIFRGIAGNRFLKHTCFGEKIYFKRTTTDYNNISFSFTDKFTKWWTDDFDTDTEIKEAYPKQFFNELLGIPTNMVIYLAGLEESNFKQIGSISTKEYETYKALLKAYATHGFRFHYNELEQICVFSDFDALDVVETDIEIKEADIDDISSSQDGFLVRNYLNDTFYKRSTYYNFEGSDFEGNYLNWGYKVENQNLTLIDGDDANDLYIYDLEFFRSNDTGFYALLVDDENDFEFYCYVIGFDKNDDDGNEINRTTLAPLWYDKDKNLLPYGKLDWLKEQGYDEERSFTLYSNSDELPNAISLTVGDTTTNIMLPLVPQVLGFDEEVQEKEISYNSVEDLTGFTFAGWYEEIDGAFGTWDNNSLLYSRERYQFTTANGLPPINCQSNMITSVTDDGLIQFGTYDNSNIQVTVEKSDDSDYDIYLELKNTLTIDSSELVYFTPTKASSTLLEVDSLDNYSAGDVLKLIEIEDPTSQQEYDWNLYGDWNYRITSTLESEDGDGNITYYIVVNNAFPDDYSFVKYPYDSIVYLNYFRIKGNPVMESSTTVYISNETSIDEYDEQEYSLGFSLLSTSDYKDVCNYFQEGFSGLDKYSQKQILTLKLNRNIHLQKGDVISFEESIVNKIDSDVKWYVLAESSQSGTAKCEFSLINLNNFNADGSAIDITDTQAYEDDSDETYEHTDSTTDTSGSVVSGEDSEFGEISLSEVSLSDFTADVYVEVDGVIKIYNISGDLQSTYSELFLPTSGGSYFVVEILNEMIYVESLSGSEYEDDDTSETNPIKSLTVLKRDFFDNGVEATIVPNVAVRFYQIVSGTDVDGSFTSTSAFIGTTNDYFKFTPEDKAEIKTTGSITFQNTNNIINLDSETDGSQILLNVTDKDSTADFQIGDTTGNYIQFNDGTLNLNGNINFDSGFTIESYSDTDRAGIKLDYDDTLAYQFSTNDSIGGNTTVINYSSGGTSSLMQINNSADLELTTFEYFANGDTSAIEIYGLRLPEEEVVNLKDRLIVVDSSGLLKVYWDGVWKTVADLTAL